MGNKYYKWNKRGSRIIIDTGYKTFDNYIVCITTGQCIGGGQTSFYIRPYNETTCNGLEHEKGYLRNYDLSMFNNNLDYQVKEYVKNITENKGCLLYEFYTYKNGVENIVGFIVEQNDNYKIFNNSYYARAKKQKCLETIVKVLRNKRGGGRE